MNPVAATIFFGLVLIVVVYSALDIAGTLSQMGLLGLIMPLPIIMLMMFGVYRIVKQLERRPRRVRIKDPLFMRTLMNSCLQRTCGLLEDRINTPALSSSNILYDILLDKMFYICATDGLRFSDVRFAIVNSGLKGTAGLVFANFFQSIEDFKAQPLPDEIRQVADTVSRSRIDLEDLLEKLKESHQALCTGLGNIIDLLPPDPNRVEKMRYTYRYRPPTPERAQRVVFAMETLAYLKASRHKNVNPMNRRRYNNVADKMIPKLAEALKNYKQAWQNLVTAYERSDSD